MSAFEAVLAAIAEHGPMLLAGVTVVLAAGLLAMRWQSSYVRRRHLGVVTAVGAGLYLVSAAVPLPRIEWPAPSTVESAATAAIEDEGVRAARLAALAKLLAPYPSIARQAEAVGSPVPVSTSLPALPPSESAAVDAQIGRAHV